MTKLEVILSKTKEAIKSEKIKRIVKEAKREYDSIIAEKERDIEAIEDKISDLEFTSTDDKSSIRNKMESMAAYNLDLAIARKELENSKEVLGKLFEDEEIKEE